MPMRTALVSVALLSTPLLAYAQQPPAVSTRPIVLSQLTVSAASEIVLSDQSDGTGSDWETAVNTQCETALAKAKNKCSMQWLTYSGTCSWVPPIEFDLFAQNGHFYCAATVGCVCRDEVPIRRAPTPMSDLPR